MVRDTCPTCRHPYDERQKRKMQINNEYFMKAIRLAGTMLGPVLAIVIFLIDANDHYGINLPMKIICAGLVIVFVYRVMALMLDYERDIKAEGLQDVRVAE